MVEKTRRIFIAKGPVTLVRTNERMLAYYQIFGIRWYTLKHAKGTLQALSHTSEYVDIRSHTQKLKKSYVHARNFSAYADV